MEVCQERFPDRSVCVRTHMRVRVRCALACPCASVSNHVFTSSYTCGKGGLLVRIRRSLHFRTERFSWPTPSQITAGRPPVHMSLKDSDRTVNVARLAPIAPSKAKTVAAASCCPCGTSTPHLGLGERSIGRVCVRARCSAVKLEPRPYPRRRIAGAFRAVLVSQHRLVHDER